MPPQAGKEPSKRKASRPIQKKKLPVVVTEKEPVSPCDDIQVRIAQRAYEIHAEHGYREGRALDDWLEAEREVLGLECNA